MLLWVGAAYFLCMATAHVTDFKAPVLFVYFDVYHALSLISIRMNHLPHLYATIHVTSPHSSLLSNTVEDYHK